MHRAITAKNSKLGCLYFTPCASKKTVSRVVLFSGNDWYTEMLIVLSPKAASLQTNYSLQVKVQAKFAANIRYVDRNFDYTYRRISSSRTFRMNEQRERNKRQNRRTEASSSCQNQLKNVLFWNSYTLTLIHHLMLCSPLFICQFQRAVQAINLSGKTTLSTASFQHKILRMARGRRRSSPSTGLDESEVRFFKIVVEESLQINKLMLPKSFTRKYWRHAPTRATLALPGCKTWEMEVFRDGDRCMWLRAGWDAFARFYSLVPGSLLHFTYLGGSTFFVRVYALNCMEIKYPLAVFDSSSSSSDSEADEDDPVEVSDYQEDEGTEDEEEEEEEEEDDEDEDFEQNPRNPVHRHGKEKMGNSSSRGRHAEIPEFVATMTRTYLKLYQAHIPGEFSKKYITESDDRVILKIGNRTWDAKLNRQGTKVRYPKFSSGWVQFARDNSLKVGDKCVFQMIKRVPVLVFEVVIVRA
ncbi:B3 domain-containing transcription factor VRN1 [Linum perenne]